MLAQEKRKSHEPEDAGVAMMIVEMDGSMLPVVETVGGKTEPGRWIEERHDKVGWKEARLALAHEPGSVTPLSGATLGSVGEAGERLAVCAREAGAGSQTKFHWVGDGAVWIQRSKSWLATCALYQTDP